jgi:hypothetical protein
MKLTLLVATLFLSISAFAFEAKTNCTYKTTAHMKGWPLSLSFEKYEVETVDLQECKDLASAKLGTTYESYMSLPGDMTGGTGGAGYVTFKIFKVKYKFIEGSKKITGSFSYKL